MKAVKKTPNTPQDLGSVVQHNFFRTILFPILAVKIVLLALYLVSHHYIIEKTLDLLRVNALETVSEISLNEAKTIDDQLREISRNNRSLQIEHQALFNHISTARPSFLEPPIKNDFGVSHSLGHSSVFVSSNTELTPAVSEKVTRTEKMEVRLGTLVDSNPNIVSSYFISWDNVVRIYPFVENFYSQHPRDFDLTQRNFYYLADAKHNPERTAVWTDVYPDSDGNGWVLSSLTPVYTNNFLEGVNVLTVTLDTFTKYFLSKDLQWDSGAVVVDKNGKVLTGPHVSGKFPGLLNLGDSDVKSAPEGQVLTNLVNSDPIKNFFHSSEKSKELSLDGKDYLITKRRISETGWQLLILTPLSVVYEPILAEGAKVELFCLLFLGLAAIFYAIFFARIKRASKKLAERITTPIEKVTDMIEANASDDETYKVHQAVNITELDKLLGLNLKIQKDKVRYHKLSEEMGVKNKQLKALAITDQLTQLYNRLKLDEVLSYEIARSTRDETPLSVAIIDIDKFKSVNDTFGHQVGDSVLVNVAQLMLQNVRSTDVLGRWGGEEFMLILPNTSLKNAYQHANKLRRIIEAASFDPVKKVTISVGIASCADIGSKAMLVELADNALYDAKHNGRNRVELASLADTEIEREISVVS